MTSATSARDYTSQEEISRPNAYTAYIAITALVALSSVCILLLTSGRADLWPTVAMIGTLCGFGALMSFFVMRANS